MYIMHFIEIAESGDSQTVEVIGKDRHDCVTAYLRRNAWSCSDYNYMERLSNRRLLVDYDEEVCILQGVTEQVVTARWVWKTDTL